MTKTIHYCPACGGATTSVPLRCTRCKWHLITRAEWNDLPPFEQGFALYMQASWPTSELAGEKNPYAKDSPKWTAFRQGEQQAVLAVQDQEE